MFFRTLQERALRLWNAKTNNLVEAEKAVVKDSDNLKEKKKQYNLAKLECRILRYFFYKLFSKFSLRLSEYLGETRSATCENIERKQARSFAEEEEEEEDVDEFVVEDEDTNIPYNPKNLPLGWDGKPIPYWLYKLHGLNIPYTCEICGNQVYKGPKTFQRHFTV